MDEKQASVAEQRAAARASWERVIGEYEASGQTGSAFCRDRGLPVWQFRYWLKALRQTEGEHSQFVTHCKASIGAAQASCASSFQRWAL